MKTVGGINDFQSLRNGFTVSGSASKLAESVFNESFVLTLICALTLSDTMLRSMMMIFFKEDIN